MNFVTALLINIAETYWKHSDTGFEIIADNILTRWNMRFGTSDRIGQSESSAFFSILVKFDLFSQSTPGICNPPTGK